MGECIVKAPKYSKYLDYDYIGFSFDGVHCCEDLGIIRISDSDRYQESMPQLKDKTSHIDGEDYTRVERSFHGPRQFKINFAFDGLTDVQLQKIRQKFMPGKEGGLWFDEAPYKVYDARVSDRVTLSYVPFDGNDGTIYKGTGTVNFVCDYPYAHTPDWVTDNEGNKGNGKLLSSYGAFHNIEQWQAISRLPLNGKVNQGENFGDLPAEFEVTFLSFGMFAPETYLQIGTAVYSGIEKIKQIDKYFSLDGKTWKATKGILCDDSTIYYYAGKIGYINPHISTDDVFIKFDIGGESPPITRTIGNWNGWLDIKLKYHYWYY